MRCSPKMGGAVAGLERLEKRVLFSGTGFATVAADGVLEVRGSDGIDGIAVVIERGMDGESYVRVEWAMNCYTNDMAVGAVDVKLSEYKGLRIFGLGGNDQIIVETRKFRYQNGVKTLVGFDLPVTLDGGAGNDIIVGGTGADVLIGGEGADWIEGGQSHWLSMIPSEDDQWAGTTYPPMDGDRTAVGIDTIGGMLGVTEVDASGTWVEVTPVVVPPVVVPVIVPPVVVLPAEADVLEDEAVAPAVVSAPRVGFSVVLVSGDVKEVLGGVAALW